MGRPRAHGEKTREQLLEVATRLLATEGVSALTVRRLADEVGVSSRAIYSLFDGMPGLLTALYLRGFAALNAKAATVAERADPLEELTALAWAYRDASLEQRDLYPLMFQRPVPWFHPSDSDVTTAKIGLERLRATVVRALRHQRIRGRDPDRITAQLWAVAHGLASLELCGALGSSDEAELVWRETLQTAEAGLFAARPARRRSVAR